MNDRLEEQLRSSLNRQADARPAAGPDIADVFGRARTIRRRRTAVVAGVAAAAVLAVVVPTTLILHDDRSGSSGLTPATSSTDPTPATPTPEPTSQPSSSVATDAPAGLGIGGISIGEHTQWTYLDPQQHLHADGATIPATLLTHGGENLTGFTPYHGGWILTYNDNRTVQTDSAGKVVREGQSGGIGIALSSDRLQTAFQIGRVVYTGDSSGMSDAEETYPLAAGENLCGLAGDGPVVETKRGYAILTAGGGRVDSATEITPASVSSQGGLIGGTAGAPASGSYSGVVTDASTGQVLWHNKWRPQAFSPDGKYVAAVPVIDNGDPGAYAILDARTGAVVAQTPDSIADKVYLGWQVVWEADDSILFQGFEAGGKHRAALLRLTLDGTFNQASEPLETMQPDGGAQTNFVLMTG